MRFILLFISLVIITIVVAWTFNSSSSLVGTDNEKSPAEVINKTRNVVIKQCLASCANLLDEDRPACEANCSNQ